MFKSMVEHCMENNKFVGMIEKNRCWNRVVDSDLILIDCQAIEINKEDQSLVLTIYLPKTMIALSPHRQLDPNLRSLPQNKLKLVNHMKKLTTC